MCLTKYIRRETMNEYYLRVMDCETGYSEMWKVKANSEQEAIDNVENNFENKEVIEEDY